MSKTPPLISCIMPVKIGHEHWIPSALACYHSQTYPNREILMSTVDKDGSHLLMRYRTSTNVRELDRFGIHKPSLGDLRNFLCRQARGEILAHWDVDDWSSTDSLIWQHTLLDSDLGAAVLGCRDMYFFEPSTFRARLYMGSSAIANLGTSLMYSRAWWAKHQFPDRPTAEDKAFIEEAYRAGVYRSMINLNLMVARTHAENTCPRADVVGLEWSEALVTDLPKGFQRTLVRGATA